MVQSYKNESKSQRSAVGAYTNNLCDVCYKVTKMRANHNNMSAFKNKAVAVTYGTKLQK